MTAKSPYFDPAFAAVTKELAAEVFEEVEGLIAAFGVACERDAAGGSLEWLGPALEANRSSDNGFHEAVLRLYLTLLALLAIEDQHLASARPPTYAEQGHIPDVARGLRSMDVAALFRALGRQIAVARRAGSDAELGSLVALGDRIFACLVIDEARRTLGPVAGPEGQAALERMCARSFVRTEAALCSSLLEVHPG
jgi:hypothetical protein